MWRYTTKPVGHPGLFVWFWSKCWVCVSPGSVSVVASWAWLWSISICWTLSLLDRSTRPCSDCQYTHVHTCSIVHVFSRVYIQLKQLQLMCVSDEHLRNKWSVPVVCQYLWLLRLSQGDGPVWSGVSGWGVSSVSTVDERQRHHRHPRPNLHCQRGGVWPGQCVCVCPSECALTHQCSPTRWMNTF